MIYLEFVQRFVVTAEKETPLTVESRLMARLAVSSAMSAVDSIVENNYFAFLGNVLNSVEWLQKSRLLNAGLDEAEIDRRLRVANNILHHGTEQGVI